MQGVTLIIAIAASFLAFLLAPIYGLIVYIATFVWYPTYLSVPVGTIDFTVRRIVILAIFAKLFLQMDLPGRFRFIWLDKLVIIYFAAQIVAGATTTTSFMEFLVNRAGAAFDMVLPYFAVRLIVKNRKEYLILVKAILIIAAPLAVLGFYECMTGYNAVSFLQGYNKWGYTFAFGEGYGPRGRSGLFRAYVTFPMSIMFGLFFAMFGPMCAGILRSAKKYRTLYLIGLGVMCVGVFSSMSSGPMLGALLSISFIALWRWRKYWKIFAIIIIIMCGLVEIISNRHFYDVLGRFTLTGSSGYRSRLMEVAIFEGGMSGHWLTGFGQGVDPGWGPRIDGRNQTWLVNHYVSILCQFGLVGLVPFLAMCIEVIKRLVNAYKTSIQDSDKWLIWCLSGALFGLSAAMTSVGLFGPPTTIFYMMVACAGAAPVIVTAQETGAL